MRILIDTTVLAQNALGGGPHSGLSLDGQQLVDEAQFFRAAVAKIFARDNASVRLQFAVHREFASVKRAEVFALTHASIVPRKGLVQCIAGLGDDTQTLFLEDAVVESVQVLGYEGVSVDVQYTIRGGAFTTDVPPEVPGETEDEEEFIVMRRNKVAVGSGVNSVAVTFSSPLSSTPVVFPHLSRPSGGAIIRAHLREDSVSTSGFTVDLSATTPNSDYVLHYIAVE